MENARTILIYAAPLLAIGLTYYFTKGEKPLIRILKFLGVLISTMRIIGIIQGFVVKKKMPNYSKACFTQAIVCGLTFVIIGQVLPKFS
jgi:hypothetical protein